MILRVCRRFATKQRSFVKPSFTKVQNPEQLLHNKEFTLKQIKQFNQSTLKPSEYTPIKKLVKGLQIDVKLQTQLQAAEFVLSAEDGLHNSYAVRFNPTKNTHNIGAARQAVDIGYRPFDPTKHSSLERNVPALNQYRVGDREVLLFNLPPETTSTDIYSMFRDVKLKSVGFEYCMLGLPSVARVQLETTNTAKEIVARYEKSGIEHPSGRLVLVRGAQQNNSISSKSLELKNRLVAITGIPIEMPIEELFSDLSRYGRVTYFHAPLNLRRKASKEEIHYHFKDSNRVIRLTEHRDDGTTEVEYYPPSPHVSAPPATSIELNSYIQKVFEPQFEIENTRYERRLRHSQNVDCYESPKENPLLLTNRGYCIVLYSCMEEAQNCYFQLLHRAKVEPAVKHEFEYDELHRKEVLRYISERVGEHQLEQYKDDMDMLLSSDGADFQESLEEELLVRDEELESIADAAAEDNLQIYSNTETPVEIQKKGHLRKIKRLKDAVPRSFDEIAEIELYGKVLSHSKQEKNVKKVKKEAKHIELNVDENDPYVNPLEDPMVGFSRHESERTNEFIQKMDRYQELIAEEEAKNRSGKRKKGKDDVLVDELPEVSEELLEEELIDNPKAGFSTVKARPAERPPTKLERFERLKAYNKMTKELIDEYFGKFSEEKLRNQEKTYRYPTLNLNRAFKVDRSDFLQEEELPVVLRMHSDPEEAHDLFLNYHRTEQVFKSLPYGERERILENLKNGQTNIQQQLTDYGEVEEVFEAPEGEDAEAVARQINLEEAKHGEHYSVVQKDGRKLIVKTARIEPLLDLAYLEKLKNSKPNSQLDEESKKILDSAMQECQKSGKVIPDSILSQASGEDVKSSIQEAIDELIQETGIPRKCTKYLNPVFDNLVGLTADSAQNLQKDFARQLQIESVRLSSREVTPNDLVKSPAKVDVKSKETGRYRTSRYGQK